MSINQNQSASISINQHQLVSISINQHVSASVSISQHQYGPFSISINRNWITSISIKNINHHQSVAISTSYHWHQSMPHFHLVHSNGFSLLCMDIAHVELFDLWEIYSHWLHLWDFIVWKGSWFWLFTHFGAIKSPRRSRGLFIAPKCVKSQNQLPLHSKMLNSSHCCEGSVLTEDIWIISEKWKWNFKCMPVFQKFASVWSCQWKWKDVWFCSRED